MTAYKVCQSCAIVITNGDDSHIHPADLPDIRDAVAYMGRVFPVEVEEDQIFSCDCCGGRIYGEVHHYEDEDDEVPDYTPPAVDTYWLRDLRNILDSRNLSDADKVEVIRDIMPDTF